MSAMISIRPTAEANGSGQVKMSCSCAPGESRASFVADAANAFPAASERTATNAGLRTGATDVFATVAERRGLESVEPTVLLLMERTPAVFVMRTHMSGAVNSKYVCATARFPVSIAPSNTGVTPPGMMKVLPMRSATRTRSEEHTSELQSQFHLVCRLLLEKKK